MLILNSKVVPTQLSSQSIIWAPYVMYIKTNTLSQIRVILATFNIVVLH